MSSCYLFTANLITLLPLILCRTQPTLSTKQKRQLQEKLEYVQEVVKTKKVVCMCADRDALIRYQFADRSNHTKPKQRNLYGCQNWKKLDLCIPAWVWLLLLAWCGLFWDFNGWFSSCRKSCMKTTYARASAITTWACRDACTQISPLSRRTRRSLFQDSTPAAVLCRPLGGEPSKFWCCEL